MTVVKEISVDVAGASDLALIGNDDAVWPLLDVFSDLVDDDADYKVVKKVVLSVDEEMKRRLLMLKGSR